ncbi:MAG: MucR family transcriptional regulator [Desulfurivibrio sp.]
MGKSLVEMAAELVQAQCAATSMTPEEVAQSLQATYNTLRGLQLDEAKGVAAEGGGAGPAISPEKSILKHKIVCLECGEEFKMISPKHLRSHGLTGREYRKKWGLPLRQALCAKELSDRRKKAGKARGLPANLRKSIAERSAKGGKSKSVGAAKTAAKPAARKTKAAAKKA